ncbi:MAG: ATP-binding protein [Magnetococcales bacterium]|nr:AAA family ATPase [Magnetococcales bacterium]NGZ25454.1 ATP-binding protein [Magnetococcales bacterium]
MNYPRIEIHELGPLTNVELTLKDFMVFIGPQASGKSTLSRVIHYFYSLPDAIHRFVASPIWNENRFPASLDLSGLKEDLKKIWSDCVYENGRVRLNWTGNVFIEFNLDGVIFSYEFLKVIREHHDNIKLALQLSKNLKGWNQYEAVNKKYLEFIRKLSAKNEVINIPTDRANIVGLAFPKDLSLGELEFFELINQIRKEGGKKESKDLPGQLVEILAQRILRGTLLPRFMGDLFSFVANDKVTNSPIEKVIPLARASSGQKDAAWLVEVIKDSILRQNQNTALIVEEPEGHLFPEGQKTMAELLGLFFNSYGNQVVMTTHSPYMISALNNLIYAKDVGEGQSNKAAEKIINPHLWIDGSRVGAYLLKDGHAQCVIDPDLGLMDVGPIHKVMDEIDDENDRLFDLEYRK